MASGPIPPWQIDGETMETVTDFILGGSKIIGDGDRSHEIKSHFSRVQFFATQWTVIHQAPLSMGFSRREYWSGLSCPPPRDLPDLGIEPMSLTSSVLGGGFFTSSTTWEAQYI